MKCFRMILACTAAILLLLSSVSAAGGYYLRDDGTGKIAVFEQSTGRCLQKTEIPVSSLNRADRTQMAQGILLPDLPSLTQAMEDFCS
mgnify:FL=1